MSAMPAPATVQAVDAGPARPKRWKCPRRRDRIATQDTPRRSCSEDTARRFVRELTERFLRWPGAYCTWARNDAIADALDLRTTDQVAYRLELAERFGLVRRFSNVRAFEAWLELEGEPDYGVGPPVNMRYATRVIVVLDRLPARVRPEGLYGPLGLDTTDKTLANLPTPDGHFCQREAGNFASAHPIRSFEGKEKMETFGVNESFSLVMEEERHKPGPATTAVDPWEALPQAERERLLSETAAAHPSLAKFPNVLKAHAIEQLRAERPELFANAPEPVQEARPAPAPIPLGNPRRGTSPRPAKAPSSNPWAEQLITDLHRLTRTAHQYDRSFRIDALGECFADLLGDRDSVAMYRSRIWEVVNNALPAARFVAAIRFALEPGIRSRGRTVAWYLSDRGPKNYPTEEKNDGGPARQSLSAVVR